MNIEYYQNELDFKVIIPDSILEEILKYCNKYFPKEFGGILIGKYSNCGKSATITEISVPTKFQNSRFFFKRFVRNLNKRLRILYTETNGDIIYIGEWHSHPNASHQYSNKDLKSISEIALDAKVKISSPLMLIVSITKDTHSEQLYVYHNRKIYRYEKIH